MSESVNKYGGLFAEEREVFEISVWNIVVSSYEICFSDLIGQKYENNRFREEQVSIAEHCRVLLSIVEV